MIALHHRPPQDVAPHLPPFDSAAFRSAMRELVGAVSVLTTGRDEARAGLTVSSVTSLSADPPCLLVCVNRSSSALPVLKATGAFAINVLRADQQSVADTFAGRANTFGSHRFACGDWEELSSGVLALSGALATFDCRVAEVIDWASHAIIIGQVVDTKTASAGDALVYWRGAYDAVT